ncbi:unnamed protein product [Toxocara canis]|uniref:Integrase n=1 Tax=Toxocara canis TaxID=6265 RepID=A0A183TVS2_TOXCA|nr:unnamed protein product [Toxocara canis]
MKLTLSRRSARLGIIWKNVLHNDSKKELLKKYVLELELLAGNIRAVTPISQYIRKSIVTFTHSFDDIRRHWCP